MFRCSNVLLCGQTDTADEKSDNEDLSDKTLGTSGSLSSAGAAEALMALAGAPIPPRTTSPEGGSSTLSLKELEAKRKRLEKNQQLYDLAEQGRHPVLREHSYSLPWSIQKKQRQEANTVLDVTGSPPATGMDHNYTRIPNKGITKAKGKENRKLEEELILKGVLVSNNKPPASTSRAPEPLRPQQVVMPEPESKRVVNAGFKKRTEMDEYNIMVAFLNHGVDQEDISMLKRCYERLLGDDQNSWLNDTHWVEHPPTEITVPQPLCPIKKKRKLVPVQEELPVHKTGSARTEGIYKADSKQKQEHKVSSVFILMTIRLFRNINNYYIYIFIRLNIRIWSTLQFHLSV